MVNFKLGSIAGPLRKLASHRQILLLLICLVPQLSRADDPAITTFPKITPYDLANSTLQAVKDGLVRFPDDPKLIHLRNNLQDLIDKVAPAGQELAGDALAKLEALYKEYGIRYGKFPRLTRREISLRINQRVTQSASRIFVDQAVDLAQQMKKAIADNKPAAMSSNLVAACDLLNRKLDDLIAYFKNHPAGAMNFLNSQRFVQIPGRKIPRFPGMFITNFNEAIDTLKNGSDAFGMVDGQGRQMGMAWVLSAVIDVCINGQQNAPDHLGDCRSSVLRTLKPYELLRVRWLDMLAARGVQDGNREYITASRIAVGRIALVTTAASLLATPLSAGAGLTLLLSTVSTVSSWTSLTVEGGDMVGRKFSGEPITGGDIAFLLCAVGGAAPNILLRQAVLAAKAENLALASFLRVSATVANTTRFGFDVGSGLAVAFSANSPDAVVEGALQILVGFKSFQHIRSTIKAPIETESTSTVAKAGTEPEGFKKNKGGSGDGSIADQFDPNNPRGSLLSAFNILANGKIRTLPDLFGALKSRSAVQSFYASLRNEPILEKRQLMVNRIDDLTRAYLNSTIGSQGYAETQLTGDSGLVYALFRILPYDSNVAYPSTDLRLPTIAANLKTSFDVLKFPTGKTPLGLPQTLYLTLETAVEHQNYGRAVPQFFSLVISPTQLKPIWLEMTATHEGMHLSQMFQASYLVWEALTKRQNMVPLFTAFESNGRYMSPHFEVPSLISGFSKVPEGYGKSCTADEHLATIQGLLGGMNAKRAEFKTRIQAGDYHGARAIMQSVVENSDFVSDLEKSHQFSKVASSLHEALFQFYRNRLGPRLRGAKSYADFQKNFDTKFIEISGVDESSRNYAWSGVVEANFQPNRANGDALVLSHEGTVYQYGLETAKFFTGGNSRERMVEFNKISSPLKNKSPSSVTPEEFKRYQVSANNLLNQITQDLEIKWKLSEMSYGAVDDFREFYIKNIHDGKLDYATAADLDRVWDGTVNSLSNVLRISSFTQPPRGSLP